MTSVTGGGFFLDLCGILSINILRDALGTRSLHNYENVLL